MTLFLTSTSKRRRDLLRQIGLSEQIDFYQASVLANFDFQAEDRSLSLEEAEAQAVDVARERVDRVYREGLLEAHDLDPARSIVVGVFTVKLFNGRLLEKPLPIDLADADEGQLKQAMGRARMTLSKLRGKSFDVLTGLAVAQGDNPRNVLLGYVVTRVTMKPYGNDDIENYLRTGESLVKAGAVDLDGRGVVLVKKIRGSYSNAAGLPLAELIHMLGRPFFRDRFHFSFSGSGQGTHNKPASAERLAKSMPPRLLLASRSPRRFELLKQIMDANQIEVLASGHAEHVLNEAPESLVKRLALEKARDVYRRPTTFSSSIKIVIGADTEVVLDGRALGQPAGAAEAREMLHALSGRTHQVLTGLALISVKDGREFVDHAVTQVTFRELTGAEINAYVESGEPFDKAGAYGIQGKGAVFIEGIDGSYSNVVGLPLEMLTDAMDKEFGLPVWQFDKAFN